MHTASSGGWGLFPASSGPSDSWHLSLKWSDSKRSDTYEINNGGKPFRTMAANGLPRYYTSLDKKILR